MSPDSPEVYFYGGRDAKRMKLVADVRQVQAEMNEQDRQLASAGREVWEMHARKCRRNLQFRYGIDPEDLVGQVRLCTCGWPEQRLREQAT